MKKSFWNEREDTSRNERDALPHKKDGKNKNSSSPNKKGCPENDYKPHNFVNYQTFWFKNADKKFHPSSTITACFDCGKRTRKSVDDEPIAQIILSNEEYKIVEFNNAHTRIMNLQPLPADLWWHKK